MENPATAVPDRIPGTPPRAGRDHAVQPQGDSHYPVSLAGQPDPDTMAEHAARGRTRHTGLTRGEPDAVRIARPVRRGGPGKRPGENPEPRPGSTPTATCPPTAARSTTSWPAK